MDDQQQAIAAEIQRRIKGRALDCTECAGSSCADEGWSLEMWCESCLLRASTGAPAPPACRDCGGPCVWISEAWSTCPSCVARSRDELLLALKVGTHRAALRRIAELQAGAPAPAEGWRDISTAPKDGREFLSYDEGAYAITHWFEGDEDDGPGWYDESGARFDPAFQFWMPLPTSPVPASSGEDK